MQEKSLFGLGMIFFCIQGFSKIAGMMTSQPETLRFLEMMQHSDWTALLSGTIFTAIVHSSSVCIGILMGFMNEGTVALQEGISFVLGSNIGTCITAVMAAISGGYAARQTAYAHVVFMCSGFFFMPAVSRPDHRGCCPSRKLSCPADCAFQPAV
ncbi:hypothetical protein BsIDN1_44440 [Bacillus safensis]|uniref:Uncharacterized protein n=1 Tax=Bacillus safensis TaxID=561879 RepID=A0A5S9MGT4_BACIA|nr:hypothetical protein BsIDN1_44440 [Bacillus safensis]